MQVSKQKIECEALSLDLQSRAQLAGKLLLSLDEPSASEVERLWLDEAERRLEEYRSSSIEGVPAGEVFKNAIADLS